MLICQDWYILLPHFLRFKKGWNYLKLDHEYTCNWAEEMRFLSRKGVPYTFVKVLENGITVWKYKKNPQLFNALSEFYSGVYSR